jgi:hypothetical protein
MPKAQPSNFFEKALGSEPKILRLEKLLLSLNYL